MDATDANGRVIDPPVRDATCGLWPARLPAAMTAAVVVVAVVMALPLPATVIAAVVAIAADVATVIASVVASIMAVGGGQVADGAAGNRAADGGSRVAVGDQVTRYAADDGTDHGALVLPRHRAGITDHGHAGKKCQGHRQTTEAECGSAEHVGFSCEVHATVGREGAGRPGCRRDHAGARTLPEHCARSPCGLRIHLASGGMKRG